MTLLYLFVMVIPMLLLARSWDKEAKTRKVTEADQWRGMTLLWGWSALMFLPLIWPCFITSMACSVYSHYRYRKLRVAG